MHEIIARMIHPRIELGPKAWQASIITTRLMNLEFDGKVNSRFDIWTTVLSDLSEISVAASRRDTLSVRGGVISNIFQVGKKRNLPDRESNPGLPRDRR